MDLSIDWKQDNEITSNKSRIVQNSFQTEEEEQFYADDQQLREICEQFVLNPYQNLKNLYEISDILIEASPSLIEFLIGISFFQAFGNFLNIISDPIDRIVSLQILLNLSRLPTKACLALIDGNELALKFLKLQIFSSTDEIRYLSLKCLKHFAQDSHSCRILIFFEKFLFDLYTILIGNKNDFKTVSLIEKIISYLLMEDLTSDDNFLLHKIAFDLIKHDFGFDISCRILYSLSEKENYVDTEFINNTQNIIKLLINAKDSKCLKYLMKFFFVRLSFIEEATSFFTNDLLHILFELFFNTNKEESDPFNKHEDKIDWSCKLIGKIIEVINEAIIQFFEIGIFEKLIALLIEGNYLEKSSSVYVLSRVLLKVTENGIFLNESQINALYEIMPFCIELIDSIDRNTVISVFDFILNMFSIQIDPMALISILSETEVYGNILMISEQNGDEVLRGKATAIIGIIQSYN